MVPGHCNHAQVCEDPAYSLRLGRPNPHRIKLLYSAGDPASRVPAHDCRTEFTPVRPPGVTFFVSGPPRTRRHRGRGRDEDTRSFGNRPQETTAPDGCGPRPGRGAASARDSAASPGRTGAGDGRGARTAAPSSHAGGATRNVNVTGPGRPGPEMAATHEPRRLRVMREARPQRERHRAGPDGAGNGRGTRAAAPSGHAGGATRNVNVTGPSLVRVTCMWAPNRPVSTTACNARARDTT